MERSSKKYEVFSWEHCSAETFAVLAVRRWRHELSQSRNESTSANAKAKTVCSTTVPTKMVAQKTKRKQAKRSVELASIKAEKKEKKLDRVIIFNLAQLPNKAEILNILS